MDFQQALFAAGVALISAVLSGSVALGVTYLTHKFTTEREAKKEAAETERERRAVLREKLERLVGLVNQHFTRAEQDGRRHARDLIAWAHGGSAESAPSELEVAPLDAAVTLAALYFPALLPGMHAVRTATVEWCNFVAQEFDLEGPIQEAAKAWMQGPGKTNPKRTVEALSPMYKASTRVQAEARKLIETSLAP